MDGNTWLWHHTTSDLTKVRGLSIVQYVLAYLPHFKVHVILKTPTTIGPGKDIRSIAIVLHEGVTSSDDALNQIKKLSSPEVLAIGDRLFQFKIDRQVLDQIAQLDQVQAIEELKQAQIHNDMIRDIVGVNRVNTKKYVKQALLSTGAVLLTGAGEVVAVANTGLDYHHEVFEDVIVKEYAADRQAETMDNNGHGTHVAGTILGREVKTSIGDSNVGVTPDAKLVVQSILSQAFPGAVIPSFNLTYLLTTPHKNNKVRIRNYSWGISIQNHKNGNKQLPYATTDAEILDQIVINHPDLLIIFSAGNDGVFGAHSGATAQIGAHASAKNILTVDATQG
ncbi:hypothetical protein MMC15_006051 [Xylographa vitiligo]|nr:hypothetical protein [Xylographa vitiligo]